MPFNVLLLPLLGGYVLIKHWNRTRFEARRHSGERLLFEAALAGVVLLIASYLLVRVVAAIWPSAYSGWHSLVPYDHAGISLGALVLGVAVIPPLNLAFNKDREIKRAVARANDYLELLLTKAQRETRHVAVSLKSGKVYVGFVVASFDPAFDRKYLTLLPTISGYRADTTHELVFTTDYTRVYLELMEEDETRLTSGVQDFEVVIPVAEIQSANYFDWDVYRRFNTDQGPDAAESAAALG